MATRKSPASRTAPARRTKVASSPDSEVSQDSLVIYVHGVGQRDPRDQLKLQWDLALFGRDMGDRSRMAYWADLVRPEVLLPTAASMRRRRVQANTLDLEGLLEDVRVPESKKRKARNFARGLLHNVGVPEAAPGRLAKKILPLPAWMRKPISRAFIQALIGDTSAYFFTPGMRRKISERLLTELDIARSRSVTIIAHSQGSIVAYEVLSMLKEKDIHLDALITIGSPLGIQEIQDYLDPNNPLKVPSVVKRWHNFSDPLDPVALDKNLAGDFSAEELVQDESVLNSNTRLQWGFNPHSAVGYLAHPKVRRVVCDVMRLDVMSRFVLARDVAERLGAAPEERHSVLIEVLEPGYLALDETPGVMADIEKAEQAQLKRAHVSDVPPLKLVHRIDNAVEKLRELVGEEHETAACIDPLRRYVSAQLTAGELRLVGAAFQELRVYAVWRSSRKAKLTGRSMRVLKADAALTSFSADGADITWAVLDTGIRSDHPHFKEVIKEVWDCTKRGRPIKLPADTDPDGHGTHVAGIISGIGKDTKDGKKRQERGVAPRTQLVVYKVLDDKGQGQDAWIIKALDHIAEQNENVTGGLAIHGLNLSLGGPFDNTVYGCGFSPICAELRRLWRSGVLVVVACGNEGQLQVQTPNGDTEINTAMSIGDPANLEDCIAVGSVNADRPHLYGVSSFSSRGPTADGRAKPDVVAPGERINSCNARYRSDKDMYYEESGTSMAAPHVSGLLAAFLSVRREFRGRPDEVKKVLLDSCIDIGRDRYHQGKGIPNLMQMLLTV
ncbi:MAG: S8 family peptidase [Polaromonas sp.]|nr:S8 family peptidase [Polaromonas sp.]MDP3753477.1 S8 family peptidase [Polaromonas sp.]